MVIVLILMLASAYGELITNEAGSSLQESSVIEIARNEAARLLNVSRERIGATEYIVTYLEHTTFFPDKAIWVVTFHDYDFGDPAATVFLESPSGSILDSTTDFIWVIQEKWEDAKGTFDLWSLEDKMLFDRMFNNPSSPSKNTLPNKTHIQQEEALQIAIDAIYNEYGASTVDLKDLLIAYSFVSGPQGTDVPYDDVWHISFREPRANKDGRHTSVYQVNLSATDGTIYLTYSEKKDGNL